MTIAAPLFLWLAAGAAATVVVLHFLARRAPPPAAFPTARFIPERAVRWPAFARRPADLRTLATRVTGLLLLGLALARPAVDRDRPTRRVVLDATGTWARDSAAVRDTLAALRRSGDTLVVEPSGSLSAALVRGRQAAGHLSADSVELVLVAPFVAGQHDAATGAIRAGWPAAVRIVRVPAALPRAAAVTTRLSPDDPLSAAVALAGRPLTADAPVRVLRAPAPADSAWARRGGTLVVWHRTAGGSDTVLGVAAGPVAVIGAFPRVNVEEAGTVVARWIDGGVAAVERPLGDGCLRSVFIELPVVGDLAVRDATRRLVRRLTARCGGPRDLTPMPSAAVARLAGDGPAVAAVADVAVPPGRVPAIPWLLAAAIAVFAIEPLVRRSDGGA